MSDKLRQAAELFARLSKDAGRELGYDEAGVEWADQYASAVRPVESDDQLRVQTALVGAYLGEALIATHGGAWREDEGEWGVDLADGRRAFPFRAAMAQLRDGEGSILELFRTLAGTADAQPEPAAVEPAVTPASLRETADRLASVVAMNGGPTEYGEALVAFVDEFVENARPVDDDLLGSYTAMVGAVLGEALIATHGAAWSDASGAWAVRVGGEDVYPFAVARRQLEGAEGESILAAFRAANSNTG
ncbi:MAG TPA: hypothetical protein VJT67_06180 [Longimicrobiaceae bacterium]|nr:hypothetical protein [Longimicrobiaceae bacterium]